MPSSIGGGRTGHLEATTCIAFQYFADEKVDIAEPDWVDAGSDKYTPPARQHNHQCGSGAHGFLGATLKAIGAEKAGIIKKGDSTCHFSRRPSMLQVLSRTAARRKSRIFMSKDVVTPTVSGGRSGCSLVKMQGKNFLVGPVF